MPLIFYANDAGTDIFTPGNIGLQANTCIIEYRNNYANSGANYPDMKKTSIFTIALLALICFFTTTALAQTSNWTTSGRKLNLFPG
ncbi:hypothetical protein [Mucilaginibacter antarcticus]